MIFKFPKKKIVLDCFTCFDTVLQTTPIDYAIKHLPTWWKNLPNSYLDNIVPQATMRGCVGLTEFYRNSVAIPLWSDLVIDIKEGKCKWMFSNRLSEAAAHRMDYEAPGFLPNNYTHLKLSSIWNFKSKENINWMWNAPLYNLNSNPEIVVAPGMLNFSKQHSTNINLIFRKDENKQIHLGVGTPIILMTPMSDRKVEIVRHLIGAEEFNMQRRYGISFLNSYRVTENFMKKWGSCPFKNHRSK